MTYALLSVLCGGPGFKHPEYAGTPRLRELDNRDNKLTPCQAYQYLLEESTEDVLMFAHDDVTILENEWYERVLEPFALPNTVSVGLGGALSLGHPDLYKRPYRIQDMARGGYRSNQTDWKTHGEQETRSCKVAVLDAFFMAVRRDWLMSRRTLVPRMEGGAYGKAPGDQYDLGWPVHALTHHCLDLWLACEAAKDHKDTWMVGVNCTHHGGGSSTKPAYREAKWLRGGSMEEDHRAPHRWLYDSYRDVLPFQVKP